MKKALLILLLGLVSGYYGEVDGQVSGSVYDKQNIPCTGIGLGSAIITGQDGTPPYSFEIDGSGIINLGNNDYNSNGELDYQFINIPLGPHFVVVYDDNGIFSDSIDFSINIDTFEITISTVVDVECAGFNDGFISAGSVQGGDALTTWAISLPGSPPLDPLVGDFINLSEGPYTIIATNSLGCTASVDTVVLVNDAFQITDVIIVEPNCNGESNGSVDINVTGGTSPYTYSITPAVQPDNNDGFFQNLEDGVYSFFVEGDNACIIDTLNVILNEQDAILITGTVTPVLCFNQFQGAISLTIGGGNPIYTYSWAGPGGFTSTNQNISSLQSGTYTVTVTDAKGCTMVGSFTLDNPAELMLNVVSSIDPTCNGGSDGSITVFGSGGTGILKYGIGTAPLQLENIPGGYNFIGRSGGIYLLRVVDANGCFTTINDTLTDPLAISASYTTVNPSCLAAANGSITLSSAPTGGDGGPYSYTDGSGAAITLPLTNLVPATYTIRVYDGTGVCFSEYSFDLVADSDLNLTTTSTPATCGVSGGTVTVNASGGSGVYSGYNLNGTFQAGSIFSSVPPGVNLPVTVTDNLAVLFLLL